MSDEKNLRRNEAQGDAYDQAREVVESWADVFGADAPARINLTRRIAALLEHGRPEATGVDAGYKASPQLDAFVAARRRGEDPDPRAYEALARECPQMRVNANLCSCCLAQRRERAQPEVERRGDVSTDPGVAEASDAVQAPSSTGDEPASGRAAGVVVPGLRREVVRVEASDNASDVPVCMTCGGPGDPFLCPKHPEATVMLPSLQSEGQIQTPHKLSSPRPSEGTDAPEPRQREATDASVPGPSEAQCGQCDQVAGHSGSCTWTAEDLAKVDAEAERIGRDLGLDWAEPSSGQAYPHVTIQSKLAEAVRDLISLVECDTENEPGTDLYTAIRFAERVLAEHDAACPFTSAGPKEKP